MKSRLIERLEDALIDCINEGESVISIQTAIKDAIDEIRNHHQTRLNKISEFDFLIKTNSQLTQEILKLRNEKNECTTSNGFNPNY